MMSPEPENSPDPLEDSASVGSTIRVRGRRGSPPRLLKFSTAGLVVVLAYLAYTAKVSDPVHLYLGLVIVVLGFLPALMWLKLSKFGLPVFETFMATTITAYGIPLISGQDQLLNYSVDTITTSALAVVLFQAVAVTAYSITVAFPKRSSTWTKNVVSGDISKYLGYGMAISTTYTVVDQFTNWIPDNLEGPVRATCTGLGIIATFVECRRWGLGELRSREKSYFVVQLVVQVVFSLVSIFLVQAISVLILGLLGYISGSKRFPVLTVAVLLPIFAILHHGKSAMRDKYWVNHAPLPSFVQLPDFFGEWIDHGLESTPEGEEPTERHSLLDRTSLIQILCLVVSNTPDRLPYMNGVTYAQIPGQFVPRFFWPGKPVGHISTYTLSIYYGLQNEEDTQKTTIGFGLLAEAYANFGLFGVGLIGAVFGIGFKKFCRWAADSPILSYPGMVMIVLMAWSFQDEMTVSLWLSSLYQACLVVCAVPFVLRNISG
jgi:hypothetical protein